MKLSRPTVLLGTKLKICPTFAMSPVMSKLTQQDINKIVMSGRFFDYTITRSQLIERFINNWFTKSQARSKSIQHKEMLNAFLTEVLDHVQKVGIETLLADRQLSEPKIILPTVVRERKLKKVPIQLEELGGDLLTDTKTLTLAEVKVEGPNVLEQ